MSMQLTMVVNAVDIYCRKCGAMPGTACTQPRTKTGSCRGRRAGRA